MNDSEAWRRETEAREWLKRTDGEPQKIRELLKRIEQKRGKEAAEVLRQDMRTEYQRARSIAAQQSTG
jgi:DNA-binding GntR family transcriptional regulator